MSAQSFRGTSKIQQVKCDAKVLKSNVKLISIQLINGKDIAPLASLNVLANTCLTSKQFTSCVIDPVNTRQSTLRVLVHDSDEYKSNTYICKITTVNRIWQATEVTWMLTLIFNGRFSLRRK